MSSKKTAKTRKQPGTLENTKIVHSILNLTQKGSYSFHKKDFIIMKITSELIKSC